MHYGDERQLKENEFQFVVYKHQDYRRKKIFHPTSPLSAATLGSGSCVSYGADYVMTSIQKCHLIHPMILKQFLDLVVSEKPFQRMMKQYLLNEPFESWYLFTMNQVLNQELRVMGYQMVSPTANPCHTLH